MVIGKGYSSLEGLWVWKAKVQPGNYNEPSVPRAQSRGGRMTPVGCGRRER